MKSKWFCFFLLCFQTVYSQKPIAIGISASLGDGMIWKKQLDGDASYELNRILGVDASLTIHPQQRIGFESGLGYSTGTLVIRSNLPPDVPAVKNVSRFHMIRIPALIRTRMNPYFYASGGLLLNLDLSEKTAVQNQSGLGAAIQLSAEMAVSKYFRLRLIPYVHWNGLILFDHEGNYPERVVDLGIKLGFQFAN